MHNVEILFGLDASGKFRKLITLSQRVTNVALGVQRVNCKLLVTTLIQSNNIAKTMHVIILHHNNAVW